MNLNYDPGQIYREQISEEILYCLPFDIDSRVCRTKGFVIVTAKRVLVVSHGEILEDFALDTISALEAERCYGSGILKAKIEDKTKILCGYSQGWFKKYYELCRLVEYYKKTGRVVPSDESDETVCPKCGRALPKGSRVCAHCMKNSKVFLRLLSMAKPYMKYLLFAVVCVLGAELLWIIYPYVQRVIIDQYIVPQNHDGAGLFRIVAGMVVMILVIMALEIGNNRASNIVSNALTYDLRQQVFSKIQRMSMAAVSKRTAGELMKRVSEDTGRVQSFVADYGKEAILRVFSFLTLISIMLVLNWRLALLVLLPIPFVVMAILKIYDVMFWRYNKVWNKWSNTDTVLHDMLSGVRVVKSYGNERHAIQAYDKASREWAQALISAETFWFITFPIIGFIITSGEFLVLGFGGWQVLGHQMQLGEMVQFLQYVTMLYVPIRWAINLPRIIADVGVSTGKIFEIIDEPEDLADNENSVDLEIRGDVEFSHVNFGYKSYKPVLKDVNFKVKQGEMIGIVGSSGVGKSTLINLIMRLYDATEGTIFIDGHDIRTLSQNALRSQIGVVLQETYLFEGSVYENIRYAKPDASFDEIVAAAKVANAHSFIVKLPDGYNTRVGNKGHSLSGGERQRIAIARAILHNPRILILDEATASLDTETEKLIQEAIQKLIANRTTFAIAHRLSTLREADRLIVLDKGTVAEIGTHQEFLRNKSVYYELVMAQTDTAKINQ